MRVRHACSALLLALGLVAFSHAAPHKKEGVAPVAPADDAAAAAGAADIVAGEDPGDALARIISENWDSLFEKGSGGVNGLLHRKRKMLGDLGFAPHMEGENEGEVEVEVEEEDEEEDEARRKLQLIKIPSMNAAKTGPMASMATTTITKPTPKFFTRKAPASSTKKAKTQSTKPLWGKPATVQTNGDPEDEPTGTTQRNCAWQTYVTGRRANVAFPDLHAVYQVLVMTGITDRRIFRIRGKFPSKGVRYFSLQANNPESSVPISTIMDFEVEPDADSGVNPYQLGLDSGSVGTYTINVTPTGKQGLPNELALCAHGKCARNRVNAVIIMRFYTADPDLPDANSKTDPPGVDNPRLFGYEGPPTVERRSNSKWNPRWSTIATCDQSRPTQFTQIINDNYKDSVPNFEPPTAHNLNNNFMLYAGQASSDDDGGMYANMDAAYLMSVAYQDAVPEYTDRLVAKVTGYLPLTPRNFDGVPKIQDWETYDVRYHSFSTMGLNVEGGPTMDTIDDGAITRFYESKTPEGETWDRTFSMVVAQDPTETCGIYNATEDVFLSNSFKGQAVTFWAILNRQLVPKATHSKILDQSFGSARMQCTASNRKPEDCRDPRVLEDILGKYYPKVQWYTCGASGDLVPIKKTLTEKLQGL